MKRKSYEVVDVKNPEVWIVDNGDNLRKVHVKRFNFEPEAGNYVRLVKGEGEVMFIRDTQAESANQHNAHAGSVVVMNEVNNSNVQNQEANNFNNDVYTQSLGLFTVSKPVYFIMSLLGLQYFIRRKYFMQIIFILTFGFFFMGYIYQATHAIWTMIVYSGEPCITMDRYGNWYW